MKKFKILGTVLALSVVTTLLVACQKEQDGVTNETSNKSTDESITAVEVNASDIPGIISQGEASELAARYAAARLNKTTAVTFSVKDIQNYLTVLKRKGSQNITVNFGMYQNGRLTVFFSGDPKRSSGNVRNSNTTEDSRDFLNHGGVVPPVGN